MCVYCVYCTYAQIVGSLVKLLSSASLSFIGNNAENYEGGALYIQDFGQIKLYSQSSIEFINNTGRWMNVSYYKL